MEDAAWEYPDEKVAGTARRGDFSPDGGSAGQGETGLAAIDGVLESAGFMGLATIDDMLEDSGPMGLATHDDMLEGADLMGRAAIDDVLEGAGPMGLATIDGVLEGAGPMGLATPDGVLERPGPMGLATIDDMLEGADFAALDVSERELLTASHLAALEATERLEFGEGPAAGLAAGLVVSPFFVREELATDVAMLEAAFYRIKEETLEACPDEEAVSALLEAFDEFAGDADVAAYVAADRMRAQWTPRENPWRDEDVPCEAPRASQGSSQPVWAMAERALSVQYVLGNSCGGDDIDVREGVPGELAPWGQPDYDELAHAFDLGVARIRKKAAEARALCARARQEMPEPVSRAMRDTLASIERSFDLYDPVLAAHVVPCDIDYQLALPVPDGLVGIDYAHEYLRRLSLENALLTRCDEGRRTALLNAWMPDWRDLVANLYEPVALTTLREVLAGEACGAREDKPGGGGVAAQGDGVGAPGDCAASAGGCGAAVQGDGVREASNRATPVEVGNAAVRGDDTEGACDRAVLAGTSCISASVSGSSGRGASGGSRPARWERRCVWAAGRLAASLCLAEDEAAYLREFARQNAVLLRRGFAIDEYGRAGKYAGFADEGTWRWNDASGGMDLTPASAPNTDAAAPLKELAR